MIAPLAPQEDDVPAQARALRVARGDEDQGDDFDRRAQAPDRRCVEAPLNVQPLQGNARRFCSGANRLGS